ncbi:MAG: FtsQ-type POTRA domain-containing protein [Cyanobacteria bacterium HKST-UBA06]|nr:FtsQ-type POTRA domain-containing protein [Cyanobacteria bacterium HKST-UBA06]
MRNPPPRPPSSTESQDDLFLDGLRQQADLPVYEPVELPDLNLSQRSATTTDQDRSRLTHPSLGPDNILPLNTHGSQGDGLESPDAESQAEWQQPVVADVADPEDHDEPLRTEAQLGRARRRQQTFLKERRLQKKRRVFFQRLKVLLRLVFILVLGAAFPLAWHYGDWRFATNRVSLTAPAYFKPKHLHQVLVPLEGQPIFMLDPAAIAETLKTQYPFIEAVYVRRHLTPTGLSVSVSEKPVWGVLYSKPTDLPAAELLLPKGMLDLSVPMYLFHWDSSRTDLAQFEFPKSHVADHQDAVKLLTTHTKVDVTRMARYKDLGQLYKQLPEPDHLVYLDISNPYDIVAQFPSFKVRLGQADVSLIKRAKRLFHILPEVHKNETVIEFVDLRWNQQVTFRKRRR